MKRLLPFIIAVFAVSKLAAQAIPDGGFETWTTPNWINPAFYGSSNAQAVSLGGTVNVTQLPAWNNANGDYAVQLKTEAFNEDTLPGYITNSIGNPLNHIGGVPFSGQPTGIELWYNYTPATGDTAGMIVVFKKSGAVIGSYLIPMVAESGYPLESYTFTPALTEAADTVIFAATSSINILSGKNGFAGSTLAISEVEFTSGTAQPADLNWNFSAWLSDTAYMPQGWIADYPGTIRTGDSYSGNYALELQTTFNGNGNGAAPGFASTGTYGPKDTIVVGGYPYTQTSDTLEFYYKYTPAITNSTDSGYVLIEFLNSGFPVGLAAHSLGAASGYTHYKLPISVGTAPDHNILNFFSTFSESGNAPLIDIGSVLKVDDVEYTSQPLTGIKPVLMDNNNILIYPNPASTQLTIASAQAVVNEVKLISIMGQTILDKQYADCVVADHESIDISKLPAGMYFISVTSGGKTTTGEVSVINK